MMKTLIFCLMLLSVISLPAVADLTDVDLDKIRLIVKDEVKEAIEPIQTELNSLDTRLENVEQGVARLEGRIDGIDKLITWLIAIIVLVFGAPQVIALWRGNKTDKEQERINQELREKIEMLEKQRIQTP